MFYASRNLELRPADLRFEPPGSKIIRVHD
jgi:hypothetical protein